MNIVCEKKGCENLLALEMLGTTSAIYAHRAYAFDRALSIQCECCGSTWTRAGVDLATLAPNPVYATLSCPCKPSGWILGKVAADHALLRHKGRTIVCQGLRYVSCDKCRRCYVVLIAASAEPGGAPVVTLTASS